MADKTLRMEALAEEESNRVKSEHHHSAITTCFPLILSPSERGDICLFYTPFSCSPYHLFVTCFLLFRRRRRKRGEAKESEREAIVASAVVGRDKVEREGEGPGRCSDWWGGMMYVAAVSPLSSGPLSLIMAISFFLGCLVCSSLSKAFLFSPFTAHTRKGLMLLPCCLFFLYSISDRNHNLENRENILMMVYDVKAKQMSWEILA